MDKIDPRWVQEYVATLLQYAEKFGPTTAMGAAQVARAEHVLDMLKDWQDREAAPGFGLPKSH